MSEALPKHDGERIAWAWWRTDALLQPDKAVETLGDTIESALAVAREEAKELRKGLEAFGAHRRGCQHIEPGGCSCGLYDLIRGLCDSCHGSGVHCVAPGEVYSDALCGNCKGTGRCR